jgi:hypothetical protein
MTTYFGTGVWHDGDGTGVGPMDLEDLGLSAGLARGIAGPLLGDRGSPPGAADDYATERARRSAELPCDDFLIVHASRSYAVPGATPGGP